MMAAPAAWFAILDGYRQNGHLPGLACDARLLVANGEGAAHQNPVVLTGIPA
jgi:hypothetical protein